MCYFLRRGAYLEMSRFSMTNLTFDKVSALSSMAWLNPFSPPACAKACCSEVLTCHACDTTTSHRA